MQNGIRKKRQRKTVKKILQKEKISADMYRGWKINLVVMFSFLLLNDYVWDNQFSKVIHDKLSKDFLDDILRFLWMKVK